MLLAMLEPAMRVHLMPRFTEEQRFDAGQWLTWANRLGYRIYLCDSGPERLWGMVFEVPNGPRGAEDFALWRAFQGPNAARKVNRTALIEHLVTIGRIVTGSHPAARPAASRLLPDNFVNE